MLKSVWRILQNWALALVPRSVHQRLKERPYLHRIANNTAWRYADQALRMGLGFLVGTYVARYLGPDQYGLLNFALAMVSVMGAMSSLGLDTVVIKYLSQEPENANSILGSSFVMRLLSGCLGLSAAVVLALATRAAGSNDRWVLIIVGSSLLFQGFDTIDQWFQSRLESKFTVRVKALPYVVCSLVKAGLVLAQASVVAFAIVGVAEGLLGAFGLVLAYNRQGRRLRDWRATLKRSMSLLNESWPLVITGFALHVQARIDQLLLGQMLGNHELGLYSAAVRVAEVFNFIPVVVVTSLFPAMLTTWKQDPVLANRRLLDLYRLMTWITLGIALPVSIFARPILSLLYGTRFAGAEGILALFVWSRLFTAFGMARGVVIAAESRFRFSMVAALAGSITNVGLNLLLIPRFGAIGSVVAMMVSFALTIFGIDLIYTPMRANFFAMIQGMITFPRLVSALWRQDKSS